MAGYAQARAKAWRVDGPQQSPPLREWLHTWMQVLCAETLAVFTHLDSVCPDLYLA